MVKPKFDLRDTTERDRMYKRYSDEQLAFYHAIEDRLFIGCNACAGSGKTLVSLHCAIELLSQSRYNMTREYRFRLWLGLLLLKLTANVLGCKFQLEKPDMEWRRP